MSLKVYPSEQACGATLTGVDLTLPLSESQIARIRSALLEHHVRQDLNETSNRVMGVLDPVKLIIDTDVSVDGLLALFGSLGFLVCFLKASVLGGVVVVVCCFVHCWGCLRWASMSMTWVP